jgi:ubiquinone/menaquinone biosynthesis C-methylase UbiE
VCVSLGDRLAPFVIDLLGARFEQKPFAIEHRRRLLAAAGGRVLEIGAGTGANLPHYPPGVVELIVSEPDRGMRRRAEGRLRQEGRAATLVDAAAHELPFPDASFDTVAATLVLCTVPDQAAALLEIRRVLTPGGQLLFLEHVRSGDPGLAAWQDRLERVWGIAAGGCHPNRDTRAALEAAGFLLELSVQDELPMVPRLVKPFIAGRAISPT